MMKLFSLSFLSLSATGFAAGAAHELELDERNQRHLRRGGSWWSPQHQFDKYLMKYNQCCGDFEVGGSPGDCPFHFRTSSWFGIFDWWERQCETKIPARCSIVDLAAANGRFGTLLAALDLADLAETLDGPGPFTVFAPTDAAFAKIDAETLEAVLADPGGALTDILLLHVVSGEVLASDLSTGTVGTLGGAVQVDATALTVNGAQINGGLVDLDTCNGVVHVMDDVILPPV